MRSSRGFLFAAAVAALLASGGNRVAAPAPPEEDKGVPLPEATPEDGDAAPADCWVVQGGAPSRSSESRTRPIRGDVEVAWTFAVKGRIEGEPRAWRQRVFVEEDLGAGKRVLHVLDAATGKETYKQGFDKATAPLAPSVWRDSVVVRANAGRLLGYAVGEHMLTPRWSATGSDFSAPILLDGAVYVRDDAEVACWTWGRSIAAWRASAGVSAEEDMRADGEIAVRGTTVYVCGRDKVGNAHLAGFRRDTGAQGGIVFVGPANALFGRAREVVPCVGPSFVLVRFGSAFTGEGGRSLSAVWVDRSPEGAGRPTAARTWMSLAQDPAVAGSTWVALSDGGSEGLSLTRPTRVQLRGAYWTDLYASRSSHAEFLDVLHAPVVTGTVALLGGRAFDLVTRDVLRDREIPCDARPVPVRGAILFVDSAKRSVVAWRGVRKPPPPAALAPAAADGPTTVEGATVLFEEGETRSGTVVLDVAAGTLSAAPAAKGKPAFSWPLATVRVVLAADRSVVLARDVAEAARLVESLAWKDAAKDYLALASDAAKANDAVLARRLLAEAEARGAATADLDRVEKAVARVEKDGPRVRDAESAAVASREAAVRARPTNAVVHAFEAAPESAPFGVRAALAREVLARVPAHPGVTAWIRSRLPQGISPPAPFDAAEWLRFVEATTQTPIRIVDVPPGGEKGLTPSQRELGSARATWRKDLVGLESGQLLLLTPLDAPGRLALTLSTGELVCDTLERVFEGGEHRRHDRTPLVHALYATQEEYLRQVEHGGRREVRGSEDADSLRWTAGVYDAMENVSKFYLPSGEDAFERALPVYAHELTHHWLQVRCPLFTTAESLAGGAHEAGAWILEGFPTFVEGFRFDLGRREVETLNPRAAALDVVANTPDDRRLPWSLVFSVDQEKAYALGKEPAVEVPLRWRLGWTRKESEIGLWYAQSGAAVAYLFHAEGGRHRPALLEAVRSFYVGIPTADVSKRFGLSEDDLGKRIVDWARDLVRPK